MIIAMIGDKELDIKPLRSAIEAWRDMNNQQARNVAEKA